MPITGSDLAALVLRDSGAFGTGQTPNGQDVTDFKARMNMMLSAWSQKRWISYHLVDTAVACDNSLSYSVGPGGDFDIPRPTQIKAAYVRQLTPSNPYSVDYPLTPIFSREDYSRIALKNQRGGPSDCFFYDSDFPLGFVYPWPLCNSQYELHILTAVPMPEIVTMADTILLPDEYTDALYWSLMIRTRNAYDLPERARDAKQARAAMNVLRQSNSQMPSLRMPRALRTPRAYNPYSDT